ncbi:MAG TPA: hypothetical protein VGC99_10120 [Candidatus Tectomicrobia bacterium]
MRRALVGHPGIRDVALKEEGELVEVTYDPAATSVAILCQQVMDTVVLPGVRNFLGRFSAPTP